MSTSSAYEIPRGPGPGFRIGEYTIKGTLGHGSMAEVYLAEDQTGHEIALKLFQECQGVSETMLERFRREAEATKKLRRHPYILTVYNTGKEGDYHFIAMEKIPNSRTFEDLLEQEKPRQRKVVQTIIKIGEALEYAHEHNIVHRDVKPANIMIDEFGEPLLADFGVAELVDWPSCTVSGALTGTPLYMSPEQARAERVGRSSDMYSLCVVLYEALTNALPYDLPDGMATASVLDAVKNKQPIRARKQNRALSKDLEYVMAKALNKDPRDRYPTIKAFMQDLERVLEGQPVRSVAFQPFYYFRNSLRRHLSFYVALGMICCFLVVGYCLYIKNMTEIRTEQAIGKAHIVSMELEIGSLDRGRSREDMSRARVNMRDADKYMISEDWERARAMYADAASLSLVTGDYRTSAIASLEQARCELMLNNAPKAIEIYKRILSNPDASPAVASMAHFEYLVLLITNQKHGKAHEVYGEFQDSTIAPFSNFTSCLVTKISRGELKVLINNMADPVKNDALLTLAVRSWLDGDKAAAKSYLKECPRVSTPKNEWPSPYAKYLYQKLF